MGKKGKKESNGLLAANGGLSEKFKAVLGEIFRRFDTDRDNALSLKELEDFAVASKSGGDLVQDELRQLGKFFDTDSKGNITLKGFEQMYLMQTGQQAVGPPRSNPQPQLQSHALASERALPLLSGGHVARSTQSRLLQVARSARNGAATLAYEARDGGDGRAAVRVGAAQDRAREPERTSSSRRGVKGHGP